MQNGLSTGNKSRNRPSRIAQIAVPSELLVTAEVARRATAPGLLFEAAGKRMLKGFDEPVSLLTVSRAAAVTPPAREDS